MTQEEKQLLLKDLCGRVLYKTYLHTDRTSGEAVILCCVYFDDADGHADVIVNDGLSYEAEDVKPYLRPMSSMTEEEKEPYYKTLVYTPEGRPCMFEKSFDWLDANHFDYRGLIEKGLALEAPEGMYKND